jgi:hypothetical protein
LFSIFLFFLFWFPENSVNPIQLSRPTINNILKISFERSTSNQIKSNQINLYSFVNSYIKSIKFCEMVLCFGGGPFQQ